MKTIDRPMQYNVLTDCWALVRKYIDADDSMCDQLLEDIQGIYDKYDNKFAREVALACANEVERIMMANRREEKQ